MSAKGYLIAPDAEQDLLEIGAFIGRDSIRAANRLIDELTARFEMLAASPGMGRRRDELSPDLRSFVFRNYLIFYRQTSEGIDIVRVLHGARDIRAIFQFSVVDGDDED